MIDLKTIFFDCLQLTFNSTLSQNPSLFSPLKTGHFTHNNVITLMFKSIAFLTLTCVITYNITVNTPIVRLITSITNLFMLVFIKTDPTLRLVNKICQLVFIKTTY